MSDSHEVWKQELGDAKAKLKRLNRAKELETLIPASTSSPGYTTAYYNYEEVAKEFLNQDVKALEKALKDRITKLTRLLKG